METRNTNMIQKCCLADCTNEATREYLDVVTLTWSPVCDYHLATIFIPLIQESDKIAETFPRSLGTLNHIPSKYRVRLIKLPS